MGKKGAFASHTHVGNSHTKFGWILSNGLGGDSMTEGDYNIPFLLFYKGGDKYPIYYPKMCWTSMIKGHRLENSK